MLKEKARGATMDFVSFVFKDMFLSGLWNAVFNFVGLFVLIFGIIYFGIKLTKTKGDGEV